MASTLTRILLVAFTLGLAAACNSTTTSFPSLAGSGGETSSHSSTSSGSTGTGGMGTGAADGGVTDEEAADGSTADGEAADGSAADGDAADGSAADGEAADGSVCAQLCVTASDCSNQATLCLVNVCNGGCCATADAPANATCSDDGGHYCDGAGVCRACLSAAQCPVSTTACATPVCTANVCGTTYASKGSTCSDSNGTVCNGAGVCNAASCSDGLRDGTETDVDCGGSCPSCGDGKNCKIGADCTDKACSGTPLTCQAPTCTDGAQNGTETDVDCGGSVCPACATAKVCARSTDCVSMNCVNLRCAAPTCSDGVQNGNETDVDCGGAGYLSASPCPPCGTSQKCGTSGTNCLNRVCTGGICVAPTCSDGVQNGNESDVDCGGTGYKGAAACPACNPGQKCGTATDCIGDTCQGTCQCPTGMLPVPIQGGGIYCIDSVEVTYGSYDAFYNANPTTSSQDPWCSWNVGWTPAGAWPYLPANQLQPVRYVNWCQAAGYCKYLGRRLCGQIGGGPVPQASFNDFSKDQWFDACTAQGANCTVSGCYPYGATYIPKECNGADSGVRGPEGYNSLLNCQGGEPNLLNMSGNVAEWEDSCDARTGSGDECAIHGGSYADDPDALRCDSDQTTLPITQSRSYTGNDVGFRCCV